jgi:hypothetical protein
MPHIYALVSGQLILYVGKTNQTLKQRENKHRSGDSSHSRYIPEYINWTMKLLETVTDDQAIPREQYYYDILKPLYNNKRPGQTDKEYRDSEACNNSLQKYRQSETYKRYRQSDAYKQSKKESLKKYRLKKKSETSVADVI